MEEKKGNLLKRVLVYSAMAFLGALILGLANIFAAVNDLFWRIRMVRERKPIEKKISFALEEEMKTGESYFIKIAIEVASGWSNRYFRESKCWKEFLVSYYKDMIVAEICNKEQKAHTSLMLGPTVFASILLGDIENLAARWYVEKIKLSIEWQR